MTLVLIHLVEDAEADDAAAASAATGALGVTMRTGQNISACLKSVRCGHMPTGLAPDMERSAHAQPSSAEATSGPSDGEASSARRIGESLSGESRQRMKKRERERVKSIKLESAQCECSLRAWM